MHTDTTQNIREKKSSPWRWVVLVSAILIFAGIVIFSFSMIFFAKVISTAEKRTYTETIGNGSDKIAIVDLDFTIMSPEGFVKQMKKYREDKSIKAIIIHVNTPGGGVAASQEMYEEVKKTRDSGKPVVVSVESINASGGYYISCGANLIVANPGSLVGSIGVIMQYYTFKELADKIGMKENTIISGENKDTGNPFRDATERDKEYLNDIVMDSYDQFLDVVSKERKIEKEELKKIATGRVFTGRQAKENGLIDSLGTFSDAIRITARLANIDGEPVLVKEKNRNNFFELFIESIVGIKDFNKNTLEDMLRKPLLQYKFEN